MATKAASREVHAKSTGDQRDKMIDLTTARS